MVKDVRCLSKHETPSASFIAPVGTAVGGTIPVKNVVLAKVLGKILVAFPIAFVVFGGTSHGMELILPCDVPQKILILTLATGEFSAYAAFHSKCLLA